MKTREKIAFVLYMINSLILIIFGFRYLFCDTVMPYHQEAIGVPWTALEPGLQVLLNGLIKIAAGFFFIPGITMIVLLIIPFKNGEPWAKWFIPALSVLWLCFGLYIPVTIALKTHASTPWPASLIGLAITLAAFLFSGVLLKGQSGGPTATAEVPVQ